MLDPEFSPGSEHVAHALMTNNTPKAWTYNAELYLVKGGITYTSSGTITFSLAAGASQTIDVPIITPGIEGTYKVYLDVFVAGELIAAYQALEDVTAKLELVTFKTWVYNAETFAPVYNALVSMGISPNKTPVISSGYTNSNGYWETNVPLGNYRVTYSKFGYLDYDRTVNVYIGMPPLTTYLPPL